MSEWLQTYNEMFGMYHAGIITTIFGAFAVTFTVLMSTRMRHSNSIN